MACASTRSSGCATSSGVGERLLATLWVGALWCVGYIAAPVLFAELSDRALAGQLAGAMFTVVAYLSLFCGVALALMQIAGGVRPRHRNWRLWLIGAMLLLIGVGEFGVRPLMADAAGADFGRLHGIAQSIYLVVSLLGLGLVAFGLERDRS